MVLTVDEVDADPERLDVLSLQLRDELLATDAEDVSRLHAGEAPPGTRGLDLMAAGGLVVTVASTLDSVAQIVETVRRWLGRGGDAGRRTVEVSLGEHHLKLSGGSAEDQERLVRAFVEAAVGGPG
jgi:hypothetical protein